MSISARRAEVATDAGGRGHDFCAHTIVPEATIFTSASIFNRWTCLHIVPWTGFLQVYCFLSDMGQSSDHCNGGLGMCQ